VTASLGVIADPAADAALHEQAEVLAAQLGLTCDAGADVLLAVTPTRVECRVLRGDDTLTHARPTWIDLTALDTTSGPGRSLQNPLLKAIGLRKGEPARPHVIDMTAGFGEDAWLLAAAGCTVEAYERHPVLYALLRDALERAAHTHADIAGRITLHLADSVARLPHIAHRISHLEHPCVVYLDPMFKAPRKTAPRKAMQLADFLLPAVDNARAMLDAALARAPGRVVVKRPRQAPAIHPPSPVAQHAGKALRFDVYRGAGALQ